MNLKVCLFYLTRALSEKGVKLAQKIQVGPCIPVGNWEYSYKRLQLATVGPTSGPTWGLSHLAGGVDPPGSQPRPAAVVGSGRIVGSEIEILYMFVNLVYECVL